MEIRSDWPIATQVSVLLQIIHDALVQLYRYTIPRPELDYNKAFGATDALSDVETALCSFEHLEWPEDMGHSYLLMYGTLQALVIQQDAVKHLCNVLGVPYQQQNFPELALIRGLRVRAAGHPSRHGLPKPDGSTFLVRQNFTRERAQAVTYFDDERRWQAHEINLLKLFEEQHLAVKVIMSSLIDRLKKDFPKAIRPR